MSLREHVMTPDPQRTQRTPEADWIRELFDHDEQHGASWYWVTLMPKTTAYPTLSTKERDRSTATVTDADLIQNTARQTVRLVKTAIHNTLTEVDPRHSRSNPERTGANARIAVLVVPALAKRTTTSSKRDARVLHFHGWIILNHTTTPDPMRTIRITKDDAPTRVLLPLSVARLVEHLQDAFGPNVFCSSTPETTAPPEGAASVDAHIGYACRQSATETTFPRDVLAVPHWYWSARHPSPK